MKKRLNWNFDTVSKQPDKIAIVTGANHGIGLATAESLGQKGIKVIMACRNEEKAIEALNKLKSKNNEYDIDILKLDLSSPSSVISFSKKFRERYDKLDILINNAGMLSEETQVNENGIEIQFATNHLGHFLLTSQLLDLVPDSESSRIVSLSSVAHESAKLRFHSLNIPPEPASGTLYGQSKLASLLFSFELDKRLKAKGKKIKSIAVHPGISRTGLSNNISMIYKLIYGLFSPLLLHSNLNAAQPSLFAALSKNADGGEYYGPQGFMEFKGKVGIAHRSRYSREQKYWKNLWDYSEQLLDVSFEV